MKESIKATLNAMGLLEPIKQVRDKLFPAPSLDPHNGIIDHARTLGVTLKFAHKTILVRNKDREIRVSPKHEIYLWDMINSFDYYHAAVHPNMINGLAVVDYSRPALHRLARSGVEFEFPSLPESDESTETYIAALNVRPGDVVLDLGAYAGASAYFLSKAVGASGKIISFEPDEINFRYLKANISRHGLENVRAVDKGVWSKTTSLEFQAEGNMGSSAVVVLGRKSNIKRVDVLSLDDAAILAKTDRIAAIKMDIEGAEVEVLKAAGDFLRRHQPRLVVEPHIVEGRMATDEICGLFRGYGYSVDLLTQGIHNWPLISARPSVR